MAAMASVIIVIISQRGPVRVSGTVTEGRLAGVASVALAGVAGVASRELIRGGGGLAGVASRWLVRVSGGLAGVASGRQAVLAGDGMVGVASGRPVRVTGRRRPALVAGRRGLRRLSLRPLGLRQRRHGRVPVTRPRPGGPGFGGPARAEGLRPPGARRKRA